MSAVPDELLGPEGLGLETRVVLAGFVVGAGAITGG